MYDRVYTSSWSDDLNALLKSQLTLIPPAVASTIKVYLCLQLLDTLAGNATAFTVSNYVKITVLFQNTMRSSPHG